MQPAWFIQLSALKSKGGGRGTEGGRTRIMKKKEQMTREIYWRLLGDILFSQSDFLDSGLYRIIQKNNLQKYTYFLKQVRRCVDRNQEFGKHKSSHFTIKSFSLDFILAQFFLSFHE